MKTEKLEIAVYQGEELLYMGTVSQCAKKMGISKASLRFCLTPTYRKRVAKSKNPDKWKSFVRLIDED